MTVNLKREQSCTYRDDHCLAPIYQDLLCANHWRLWKSTGGEFPGDRRRYSAIQRNGDLYEVIDRRTGKVVISEEFFDEAADKLNVLRLDEELAA